MRKSRRRKPVSYNLTTIYFTVCILGMFAMVLAGFYVDKVLAETEAESVQNTIVERVVYKTRIKYIEVEAQPILTEMDCPASMFMSICAKQKITREGSRQLAYVILSTTDEIGFCLFQDRFMVAMGSYYGDLGSCFLVTLSNGVQLEVVMTERKRDDHTDRLNQHHLSDGSVIEFIIDRDVMDKNLQERGDMFAVFGGYPVKIERIENP